MAAERSEWTVDTMKEHLLVQISDLRFMLDERYATQSKALDAALVAQQVAMRTALEAAEKAVSTALTSAEKAVSKAEVAAEKRFESVNEFRGQLADQAAQFITRQELDIRIGASSDKIEALTSRIDSMTGTSAGSRQTFATFLTIGAIVVTIVIAISTVLVAR